MDTIAESAARLCDADDAVVRRLEGGRFYAVSHYGAIPMVRGLELIRFVIAAHLPAERY